MIKLKIHKSYRTIVALADSDLIGKSFEEDIKKIEVNPNFFDGKEKDYKSTLEILKDMGKEDATFNIVGDEACKCALEAGIIKKQGIFTINNIPVALVLL